MTVEIYQAGDFQTSHERQAVDRLIGFLNKRLGSRNDPYLVLVDYSLGGKDIDLTILKRNGILIIELKSESTSFKATENEWITSDNRHVGGSSYSPFRQVRDYRNRWKDLLQANGRKLRCLRALSKNDFDRACWHTKNVVAISPHLPDGVVNEINVPWFELCGLEDVPRLVEIERAKFFNFSAEELRIIAKRWLRLEGPHAGLIIKDRPSQPSVSEPPRPVYRPPEKSPAQSPDQAHTPRKASTSTANRLIGGAFVVVIAGLIYWAIPDGQHETETPARQGTTSPADNKYPPSEIQPKTIDPEGSQGETSSRKNEGSPTKIPQNVPGSQPVPSPIPKAPKADFGYSVTDLEVTFSDRSRGLDAELHTWRWDFGDGMTSPLRNPTHAYEKAGMYTVRLTVTDGNGLRSYLNKEVTLAHACQLGACCGNPRRWQDAKYFIGQEVAISGPVHEVTQRTDVRGSPTWINVGGSYPDKGRLELLIWGRNLSRFGGSVKQRYEGKEVCAFGKLTTYKGMVQMELENSNQLTEQ